MKAENRRRNRVNQERRPVVLPHLPAPSTPPPSTLRSTPPPQNTPLSHSEGQHHRGKSDGASPSNTRPPAQENTDVQTKEDVSLAEGVKLRLDCVGPARSPSPPSMLSNGSLSDLSGPPSPVFTTLSGCISGPESRNACQDHRPSSGGCGLTSPFLIGQPSLMTCLPPSRSR